MDLILPRTVQSGGERQARINLIAALAFMYTDLINEAERQHWEASYIKSQIIELTNIAIDKALPYDEAARTEIWVHVARGIQEAGRQS